MINKAIIVGRVGKDPEIRYTGNGDPVATLSVATSEKYKDKSGAKQEKTEWHNLVAYGKTAEVIQQWVTKGTLLYVEGKISTRKWQDKQGNDRYTTEINVQSLQMLGGGERTEEAAPARTRKPLPQKAVAAADLEDSDLPF